MVVYLEVAEGPKVGQRYLVWKGVCIGRSTGDVIIDDPKISSLHAQVEADDRGNLFLVDQDSANGLRINGQKVKRVSLLLGVRFLIGKTLLRVAEIRKEEPPAGAPVLASWKEVLLAEVPRLVVANHLDSVMRVEAFRPALQLDFIEGIQLDTRLVIGYGPRRLGSDVLDIELYESLCPPIAFELLPANGEAFMRTAHPSLVLVNQQSLRETLLHEGDLIRIGETLIQVSFAS